MAYGISLNEDHILCRSPHTGQWILRQRNSHYGYFATIHIWGESLGLNQVREAADKAAVCPDAAIQVVEKQVRDGVKYSMLSRPDFDLKRGDTI